MEQRAFVPMEQMVNSVSYPKCGFLWHPDILFCSDSQAELERTYYRNPCSGFSRQINF